MSNLNIQSTKVTDAGLANLKGCKNLFMLWLSGPAITDEGLKNLAGPEAPRRHLRQRHEDHRRGRRRTPEVVAARPRLGPMTPREIPMPLSPSRKALSAALVVAGVVLLGCSGGVNVGRPKRPLGATQYRLSSAAFTQGVDGRLGSRSTPSTPTRWSN